MKRIVQFFNLIYLSFITSALAQNIDEVFDDVEEKGSEITCFLTSGYFALAVVTIAIIYIAYAWINRKIEVPMALTIFFGSVALGKAPAIASWLTGVGGGSCS